jgi:HlyD family secretion protein
MEVHIVNRWLKRAVVLAAVVLVIVVLRLTVFRPKPVPVTVFDVARGRVEATVVNSRAGTIKSRHRSQMSPGVSGLVARIPVRKGQPARHGQVLLQLDDRQYQAQVTLAERSLDAARASADEACLNADQAERDRLRSEDLFAQNLISDQDLDTARTRAEVTRAGCVAAQAQIRQSAASLDEARATLAQTVITAPFDGVVLDVTTEVGEWISPSPPGVFIPPVVDLIDPTTLYVEAPLDEADVAKVTLDLPVRITMDAFRGQSFPGTLTYISSFVETTQEENRTLTVEAEFAPGDLPANVLPGLSADIEVILDARDDVIRIPSYALMEGDRVLLVRDGRLRSVPVTPGLHNWEYTEIRSGLAVGDQVVVSLDRQDVVAGARVEVIRVQTK